MSSRKLTGGGMVMDHNHKNGDNNETHQIHKNGSHSNGKQQVFEKPLSKRGNVVNQ